jgi:hypothetical protein
VQYSRSLLIITGHSGAPTQLTVDLIANNYPDHTAVRPVGTDKAIGFRSQDIENAVSSGKAAVVATYDPSSTAVLLSWAEREGIRTHTVFVKAPQELSFSRAMGNWRQAKSGKAMDTLLPDIESMNESDLLRAYERGEVSMIDKPHYRNEMTPKEMLQRFSSIIHSEPMWEESISHDVVVDYEPAFGMSLSGIAAQVVSRHADLAVTNGYAAPNPAPARSVDAGPEGPRHSPSPSV